MKAKLYALAITLFTLCYAMQGAAPAEGMETVRVAMSPATKISQPAVVKISSAQSISTTKKAPVKKSERIVTKAKTPKQVKIESKLMVIQDKSPLIAALLAFFLGWLGVHRFYLGYTWQGVVQFFTLGGFGVWYIIDFIRILVGDLKEKEE